MRTIFHGYFLRKLPARRCFYEAYLIARYQTNLAASCTIREPLAGHSAELRAKTFLRSVCSSAKRMETLVRDLLQYVETAHADEVVTDSNEAPEVLRDVLASLSATLEETRAEVSVDPLSAFRIRRVHLQQVFQNLVSNALKYRGVERPKIHISAQQQGREWVFAVQDNGIGI